MSRTFDFENLVDLCQGIREKSETVSRKLATPLSGWLFTAQIPQTLSVKCAVPSLIGAVLANSAILQAPSAESVNRDSKIPGIRPALSVKSKIASTQRALRCRGGGDDE